MSETTLSESLNKLLSRSAKFAIGTALISSSILAAHAGNMYIYKDNSGQVLLTNVNPSGNFDKFTKKVKVTYYPSSDSSNNYSSSGGSSAFTSPSTYSGYGSPSGSSRRDAYDDHIRTSAARHGVDPALMKAMMHTESAFNPNARSPVGAQGLMQLMPATARRFKVRNAWSPSENIEGAAKYIAWLTKRFNGRIEHVVAGYNAGEGNVDKYGGIPPFKETRNYVKKVLGRYNSLYKNDAGLMGASSTAFNGTASIQRVGYNGTNTAQPTIQRSSFATSSNSYSQTQEAFDALRSSN